MLLYNIWDAGSAKTLAKAGATALATGSWSVAGAQGYADGEALPLEFLLHIIQRIVESVDLLLSVDFEGGYVTAPDALAEIAVAGVARVSHGPEPFRASCCTDLAARYAQVMRAL